MRINFVCFDLGRNGGTKAIIEFANHLTDLGHEVNVIYPKYILPNPFNYDLKTFIPMFGSKVLRLFRGSPLSDGIKEWIDVRCKIIKVAHLDNGNIPEADFTFATWWETAFYVNKLNDHKGQKCYLIQHYEDWGGRKSQVDKTYKMGFLNIVHSNWLRDKIIDIGGTVDALITHAPEKNKFKPKNCYSEYYVEVLMPFRKEAWKGGDDGLKAFELACEKCDNLKLRLVGDRKYAELYSDFYSHISYLGNASIEDMNSLYNVCNIFLHPSKYEGFGIMPMESMCCGCAVVSTRVGAVTDYCKHGHNALLCDSGDVDTMAAQIVKLVKNKDLRRKLAKNGLKTMRKYSWKQSSKLLEKFLKGQVKR